MHSELQQTDSYIRLKIVENQWLCKYDNFLPNAAPADRRMEIQSNPALARFWTLKMEIQYIPNYLISILSHSLTIFRQRLKTFLFQRSYPDLITWHLIVDLCYLGHTNNFDDNDDYYYYLNIPYMHDSHNSFNTFKLSQAYLSAHFNTFVPLSYPCPCMHSLTTQR